MPNRLPNWERIREGLSFEQEKRINDWFLSNFGYEHERWRGLDHSKLRTLKIIPPSELTYATLVNDTWRSTILVLPTEPEYRYAKAMVDMLKEYYQEYLDSQCGRRHIYIDPSLAGREITSQPYFDNSNNGFIGIVDNNETDSKYKQFDYFKWEY